MFKDAAALDRQRTATSFARKLSRYSVQAERWFDGTVDSVDRRLAACDQLRHAASFTVARLSIGDSQRYLEAAQDLDSDRRALLALRDDLLTGASGREDVVGPPGWRTSREKLPGAVAGSNEFEHPAPRTNKPRHLNEISVTKVKTKVQPLLTGALHYADGPDDGDPPPDEEGFLKDIGDMNIGPIGASGTNPGKMWLGQGGPVSSFEPQT